MPCLWLVLPSCLTSCCLVLLRLLCHLCMLALLVCLMLSGLCSAFAIPLYSLSFCLCCCSLDLPGGPDAVTSSLYGFALLFHVLSAACCAACLCPHVCLVFFMICWCVPYCSCLLIQLNFLTSLFADLLSRLIAAAALIGGPQILLLCTFVGVSASLMPLACIVMCLNVWSLFVPCVICAIHMNLLICTMIACAEMLVCPLTAHLCLFHWCLMHHRLMNVSGLPVLPWIPDYLASYSISVLCSVLLLNVPAGCSMSHVCWMNVIMCLYDLCIYLPYMWLCADLLDAITLWILPVSLLSPLSLLECCVSHLLPTVPYCYGMLHPFPIVTSFPLAFRLTAPEPALCSALPLSQASMLFPLCHMTWCPLLTACCCLHAAADRGWCMCFADIVDYDASDIMLLCSWCCFYDMCAADLMYSASLPRLCWLSNLHMLISMHGLLPGPPSLCLCCPANCLPTYHCCCCIAAWLYFFCCLCLLMMSLSALLPRYVIILSLSPCILVLWSDCLLNPFVLMLLLLPLSPLSCWPLYFRSCLCSCWFLSRFCTDSSPCFAACSFHCHSYCYGSALSCFCCAFDIASLLLALVCCAAVILRLRFPAHTLWARFALSCFSCVCSNMLYLCDFCSAASACCVLLNWMCSFVLADPACCIVHLDALLLPSWSCDVLLICHLI